LLDVVSCKWKLRTKGTGEKELLQWYESERKIGLQKLLSSTSPPTPESIISYVETSTKKLIELFGGKLKSTCDGYRAPKDSRILVKRNTNFLSTVKPIIQSSTRDVFSTYNMDSLSTIKSNLDVPATQEVNWRDLQTPNYFTYLFGPTYEDSVEKFIAKNIVSTIDFVLDKDYKELEKIGSIGEGGRGAVLTVIGAVIANLVEGDLSSARAILSLSSFVSSSQSLGEVLKPAVGPITGIDLKGFESAHSIGGDGAGNVGIASLNDILSLPSPPAHFKLIHRSLSHIPLPLATLLCASYLNLRDLNVVDDLINVVIQESVNNIVEKFLFLSSPLAPIPSSSSLPSNNSDFKPPSPRLLSLLMSTAAALIKNTNLSDLLFTATSPSSYNLTKVLRSQCIRHIEASVTRMYSLETREDGEDAALQMYVDLSFYKFCNPSFPPQLASFLEAVKRKADPMAIELANVNANVPAIYHSHSSLLNALFTPVSSQVSTPAQSNLPPSNSLFEIKTKFAMFAVTSEEEEDEEERRRKRAKKGTEKKESGFVATLFGGLGAN